VTRYVHDSIAKPTRTPVRRIGDYAIPRKDTRGQKLTGNRFSRATQVVTRYIDTPRQPAQQPELTRRVYRGDGLGPYSETRGKLYA
jgi:hypothetical protein